MIERTAFNWKGVWEDYGGMKSMSDDIQVPHTISIVISTCISILYKGGGSFISGNLKWIILIQIAFLVYHLITLVATIIISKDNLLTTDLGRDEEVVKLYRELNACSVVYVVYGLIGILINFMLLICLNLNVDPVLEFLKINSDSPLAELLVMWLVILFILIPIRTGVFVIKDLHSLSLIAALTKEK